MNFQTIISKGIAKGFKKLNPSGPQPSQVVLDTLSETVLQHLEIAADLQGESQSSGNAIELGIKRHSAPGPVPQSPIVAATEIPQDLKSLFGEEKLGSGAADAIRELSGVPRDKIIAERAIANPDSTEIVFDPSKRVTQAAQIVTGLSLDEIEAWVNEKLPKELEMNATIGGSQSSAKFYLKVVKRRPVNEKFGQVVINYIPAFASVGPTEVIFEDNPANMDVMALMASLREKALNMYRRPTAPINVVIPREVPYSPGNSMSSNAPEKDGVK